MAFDSSSKFRLVDQATLMPGKCMITGTTVGKFVDTGISLNKFDGMFVQSNQARVYISVDVIKEIADGLGLFDEIKAKCAAVSAEEYAKGYSKGVSESGELVTATERLFDAWSTIRLGASTTGPEAPGADSGDESPVFVLDGPTVGGNRQSGDEQHATSGQGISPGSVSRSSRLPSDSGHERAGSPVR